MSPPYAPPPPVAGPEADDKSSWQAELEQQGTHLVKRPTPTALQYEALHLGRRLILHQDPAVAAALAVEELGPHGAVCWARRLLEELRT